MGYFTDMTKTDASRVYVVSVNYAERIGLWRITSIPSARVWIVTSTIMCCFGSFKFSIRRLSKLTCKNSASVVSKWLARFDIAGLTIIRPQTEVKYNPIKLGRKYGQHVESPSCSLYRSGLRLQNSSYSNLSGCWIYIGLKFFLHRSRTRVSSRSMNTKQYALKPRD